MKPAVKYVVWALVLGAVAFAGYKGYKYWQAKKAASE
jgi:predicted negative regulator of RcsB-dependent stress response